VTSSDLVLVPMVQPDQFTTVSAYFSGHVTMACSGVPAGTRELDGIADQAVPTNQEGVPGGTLWAPDVWCSPNSNSSPDLPSSFSYTFDHTANAIAHVTSDFDCSVNELWVTDGQTGQVDSPGGLQVWDSNWDETVAAGAAAFDLPTLDSAASWSNQAGTWSIGGAYTPSSGGGGSTADSGVITLVGSAAGDAKDTALGAGATVLPYGGVVLALWLGWRRARSWLS
jgi:hypothetical protein